jgi:hypothetical protein
MCAPTLSLSIIVFLVSGDQRSEAAHKTESQELPPLPPPPQYLSGKIAASVTAASLNLSSLSHLQAQDAVIYLDKHTVPFLENNKPSSEDDNEEVADEKKTTSLSARQVSTLGWHLFSQLPPPSFAFGNLRVLVLVTPPNIRPLVIETTSSTHSKTSYKISETVLVVLMPIPNANTAQQEVAAHEILHWLSAYTLEDIAGNDGINIAQQCMQKASLEILNFFEIVNRAPKTGIKITSHVADAAATAAQAYNLAEESFVGLKRENKEGCLQQCRVAWEAARSLAIHTDLGVTPQLPSEHVIALLLPIGLPILLAIAQAVGRELKEAKKLLLLLRKENTEKKKKES